MPLLSVKGILIAAGVSGCLSVMLGAFAAHGLKNQIGDEMLAVFNTGVKYQSWHACVLLFLGLMAMQSTDTLWRLAAVFIVLGMVLFSGSLYGLSVGGPRWLGPITPLGGLSFIVAWLCIICAAVKLKI